MSIFDLQQETIRHESWPAGHTVTVRELSWAEMQDLQHVAMSTIKLPQNRREAARQQQSTTLGDMSYKELKVQTMLRAIVSWTFEDGEGNVAPVDYAHVCALPERVGDFIMEAVDGLNPDRDADFPE